MLMKWCILLSSEDIGSINARDETSVNRAREQVERLTTNYDFDFKVGLADPIHCLAELFQASIICQVARVNQNIACW